MSRDELAVFGKIVRPHGIHGEIKVLSSATWSDSVLQSGAFLLRLGREKDRWIEAETVRKHGDVYFIKIAGIVSRNEAEALRGGLLLLGKEKLLPLEENSYFIDDLIGLTVLTTEGARVGILEDVFQGGAHDIYVVRDGEKELLVPAVKAYIKQVDLTAGTMTIEAVEGLLD